jgi:hypothetical protein
MHNPPCRPGQPRQVQAKPGVVEDDRDRQRHQRLERCAEQPSRVDVVRQRAGDEARREQDNQRGNVQPAVTRTRPASPAPRPMRPVPSPTGSARQLRRTGRGLHRTMLHRPLRVLIHLRGVKSPRLPHGDRAYCRASSVRAILSPMTAVGMLLRPGTSATSRRPCCSRRPGRYASRTLAGNVPAHTIQPPRTRLRLMLHDTTLIAPQAVPDTFGSRSVAGAAMGPPSHWRHGSDCGIRAGQMVSP